MNLMRWLLVKLETYTYLYVCVYMYVHGFIQIVLLGRGTSQNFEVIMLCDIA